MTKAQLVAQLDGERRTADRLRAEMRELRKLLGCNDVFAEVERRQDRFKVTARRNAELALQVGELTRRMRQDAAAAAGARCAAIEEVAALHGQLTARTSPVPF